MFGGRIQLVVAATHAGDDLFSLQAADLTGWAEDMARLADAIDRLAPAGGSAPNLDRRHQMVERIIRVMSALFVVFMFVVMLMGLALLVLGAIFVVVVLLVMVLLGLGVVGLSQIFDGAMLLVL